MDINVEKCAETRLAVLKVSIMQTLKNLAADNVDYFGPLKDYFPEEYVEEYPTLFEHAEVIREAQKKSVDTTTSEMAAFREAFGFVMGYIIADKQNKLVANSN